MENGTLGFNTAKALRAVMVEPVYGAHHGTEVGLGFDRDVENSEERGGNESSFGRGAAGARKGLAVVTLLKQAAVLFLITPPPQRHNLAKCFILEPH